MTPTGATVLLLQRHRHLAVVANPIILDDVDAVRNGWDEPSAAVTTEVEVGVQLSEPQSSETRTETASAPRDDDEVFLNVTGLGLDGEIMANTSDRVQGVPGRPADVLAAARRMDRLTAEGVTRGDVSPPTPPRAFPARQGVRRYSRGRIAPVDQLNEVTPAARAMCTTVSSRTGYEGAARMWP